MELHNHFILFFKTLKMPYFVRETQSKVAQLERLYEFIVTNQMFLKYFFTFILKKNILK